MSRFLLAPLVMLTAVIAVGASPQTAKAQLPTLPLVEVVDIEIDEIVEVDGELVANATVTLDVLGRTVTRTIEIPLDLDGSPGAEGTCDILHLALGPVHLDLLGLVVDLDDCNGGPVVVDIQAIEGGGLLGDLLCDIAGALEGGIDLGTILEGLTDEELVTLTTGLEDVLNELLDQVVAASLTNGDTSVGSNRRGCDILSLEIPDGLTLTLLGLQVDTSGICLHVHAERGGGNLLGNLLCNVARLVDRNGNARAANSLVRQILRIIDRRL